MAENRAPFGWLRAATYVACASIIAIGVPASAYAVASAFNISDPTHPAYKAHVSSAGKLLTDASGSKVAVSGTVGLTGIAQTKPAGTPWSSSCGSSNGYGCSVIVPSGHTLDVRTVSVFVACSTSTDNPINFVSLDGNAPNTTTSPFMSIGVASEGGSGGFKTYSGIAEVDAPVVVPAGGTHVLHVETDGCPESNLSVYGYLY